MTHPGPWIEQDTLTGSTTLTPGHDDEDFSGGNHEFTVGISNSSTNGARNNINDTGQTLEAAWDMVRGADALSDPHTRTSGTGPGPDWYAGFVLYNNGLVGWDATLQSVSLLIDAVAFNDYENDVWPAGAIDVEVDGTQFWDLRVEAFADEDTVDRAGFVGDYTLFHEAPGSWRVANADIATTTTFPQELLASTPAGSVLDYTDVPQSNAFLGTRVLPLFDMLAGSAPALDESVPPFGSYVYQYTYTFTVGVDITVRRPRYRYIFEGGGLAPLRRHPRSDGYGLSATRHYPPPRSRRGAGGIR